ncbi:SH3 domain-containing protein [Synechococcus sp. RedBA-s]|uniref:SH3 domain-containing protein n=1 Tax=Synechococcus sp. RedBA-s TaxID=2823741 RepID=UPI0020CED4E5|nr:SH3 domain-containing protein [Synechococcus sp. RedBA-s]MCP9801840.1 SH3 domain-containing protein [Synechococcus sp. RedBA-s]
MDWRLPWVLGLALIAPAALPAGGGERRSPELRRRQHHDPLLANGSLALRCAPRHSAPTLAQLERSEPLRLLRTWWEPGGDRWLQVQISSPAAGQPSRGWLSG